MLIKWLQAILDVLDFDVVLVNRNKLIELTSTVRQINLKLGGALGEPDATSGGRRRQEQDPMATLDEALQAVRDASTRTDSIIADRASLKQQLDDALSGVSLPAGVQAKIDEIFTIEKSDAEKIDAALNANVPPPEPEA